MEKIKRYVKSMKPRSSDFHKWKVAFREKVHILIEVGYTRGRSHIESDDHEEQEITEFLVSAIRDWMRSPESPPWCKYFDVHEEAPVPKQSSHGKSRRTSRHFDQVVRSPTTP